MARRPLPAAGSPQHGKLFALPQFEFQPLEDRGPVRRIALAEVLEPQNGGIRPRALHTAGVPPASSGVDSDQSLDLQKVAQAKFTVFAAVAGHLESAERCLHI